MSSVEVVQKGAGYCHSLRFVGAACGLAMYRVVGLCSRSHDWLSEPLVLHSIGTCKQLIGRYITWILCPCSSVGRAADS